MYIVKNLKDYNLIPQADDFCRYLKDNVDSFGLFRKVTNRSAMRKYFAPDNDFIIYSTAVAEPVELLALCKCRLISKNYFVLFSFYEKTYCRIIYNIYND